MRVVGVQLDSEGVGASSCNLITSEEEDLFRRMAASPNIYDRLANSIAPSIYGAADIKKAIACLLFGGDESMFTFSLLLRHLMFVYVAIVVILIGRLFVSSKISCLFSSGSVVSFYIFSRKQLL